MRRILALGFVLALLTTAPVHAWNRGGHMVTGAIAYQVLKEESEPTIAKVVALLKQHPDFKTWDKQADNRKLKGADRDLYFFMMAARWADDARDNPVYYPPDAQHDKLHYINYPYKPAGEPDSVKTTPPADINIIRGYADKLAIVGGKSPDAERAVALCWVFHMVGDVHQPLHVASRFSNRYPKGDRGGNACYIRATEKNAPINLHKFWDDLITGSEGFQTVRNTAIELRLRKEHAKDKLTELAVVEFEQWAAKETLELAKKYAYLDGKLEGSPKMAAAPALPEDYAKTTKPVAERQALLAGYRLAATLRKQFDN